MKTEHYEILKNALLETVNKEGLQFKSTKYDELTSSGYGENRKTWQEYKVDIIDPNNDIFNIWVNTDSSEINFYFNCSTKYNEKSFINGKYSDGSNRWISHSHDLDYMLSDADLESCGAVKIDYRLRLPNFSKTSKISKNPKLISNDFLKMLKDYKKFIDLVTPKVKEKIEKREKKLIKMNELRKIYKMDQLLKPENFNIYDRENNQQIEISEYGHIKIIKTFDNVESFLESLK